MDDEAIVALYFDRNPAALLHTQEKYGHYCHSVAYHILHSFEDAQECVNDTWLRAWNAIPPTRPKALSPFLGRITRNLSLQRWRAAHAQKRGGGEAALVFEELSACIPAAGDPEQALAAQELEAAVRAFLADLRKAEREVFLARYWFFAPVREIATRFGYSEGKVKTMLHRTRKKLREHLEKEGLL